MSENTINPFKDVKRTNWAKKTQDRLLVKNKVEKEAVLKKKIETIKIKEKKVIKNK